MEAFLQTITLPKGPTPTNGFGGLLSFQSSLSYTPDEIRKMVDQHETDVIALRNRMEADYDLYRLKEHINRDLVTGEKLTDYAVYTSSEPRAFANKVISWLAEAELLNRVPHINDRTHPPETDNLKENVVNGLLRAADERLIRTLHPDLQSALSFYVTIRGGIIGGRCLLAKHPDGSTYVDIMPWDPLNTHYGIGAEGLEWACYKIRKTRQQIQNEYGVVIQGDSPSRDGSTDPMLEGIYVYDFYDRAINTILTEREVLKPPTLHGAREVPAYMVLVGHMPMLQPMSSESVMADVGESIYEALRNTYQKYNFMMSVMLELTARARRQGLKIFSKEGTKTLPEDPHKEGTEISLRTGEEDVVPLGLLEMARETPALLGELSAEKQRASLPHSAYGELQFQLSGFAINTLRQGIETILSTRLKAMEQVYLQIDNLLYDQYRSEYFEPMELSGMGKNRKYFSQTIRPEMLTDACDFEVKIVSQLPQDEMSKWTMAQIARQGPTPLAADAWIRDNVLGIQDAEQMENQVKLQMAERALPEAGLYSLMLAAEEQGRPDLAKFYMQKLMQLIGQLMGVVPPDAAGMRVNQLDGGQKPTGLRPEVSPEAQMGSAPQPETSNNGPSFVAPGTPRPAAQGQP